MKIGNEELKMSNGKLNAMVNTRLKVIVINRRGHKGAMPHWQIRQA